MIERVKVSPKFQVVIPRPLRDQMKLVPGEELEMLFYNNSIRIQRKGSLRDLKGIAKGLEWKESDRDRSDRF
jgi:AbrB family looped-hinge helix DNA binding protein